MEKKNKTDRTFFIIKKWFNLSKKLPWATESYQDYVQVLKKKQVDWANGMFSFLPELSIQIKADVFYHFSGPRNVDDPV